MNRIERTRASLTATFAELAYPLVILSPQEYDDLPLKPAFRYGWIPPVRVGDGKWAGQVCLERIVEAGSSIEDEDDYDHYIMLIEYFITRHIVLADEIPDPLERQRRIEDEAHDKAPDMIRLVTHSQFQMLDAGAN